MSTPTQTSLPGFTPPTKTIQTLSPEECTKILQAAERRSLRDKLMIETALYTGLRNAELIHLNVEHIAPFGDITPELEVTALIAKNRKPRTIPLHQQLREDLARFLDWKERTGELITPVAPLFVSTYSKRRLTPRDFQRITRAIAIQAIHRKVHPHVLRHTFATRIMRQANIRVVQQLLGHASIQTTQIYTHPNSDDCRQAIQTL